MRTHVVAVKTLYEKKGKIAAGSFAQLLLHDGRGKRYGIAIASAHEALFVATGLPDSAPGTVQEEVFDRRTSKELAALASSVKWDEKAPARRDDLETALVKKGKLRWSSASTDVDRNDLTGHVQYSHFFLSVEWAFREDGTCDRVARESGSSIGYNAGPGGDGRHTGGALGGGHETGKDMPFEVWDQGGKTWLVVRQAGGACGFHALEMGEKLSIDGLKE